MYMVSGALACLGFRVKLLHRSRLFPSRFSPPALVPSTTGTIFLGYVFFSRFPLGTLFASQGRPECAQKASSGRL